MITLLVITMISRAFADIATDDVLMELKPKAGPQVVSESPKRSVNSSTSAPKADRTRRPKANIKSNDIEEIGNLPRYSLRKRNSEEISAPLIIPKNEDFNRHKDLLLGDTLRVSIPQNIVAYNNSKSPITGTVIEGNLKGASVFGEATMDMTTKRVNITITSIRPKKSKKSFSLNGSVLSEDGLLGIEGKYESDYWNYFWAEAITNTVAGFAEAAVPAYPSVLGNIPEHGIESAAKKGAAHGLKNTADRLGDRMNTAPEMTTVTGPTLVTITITQ